MAIDVATTSTVTWGVRDPITITKPSGTTDDDLLIAVIVVLTGNTIDSVPSGWTLADSGTTFHNIYVYYKIASSEGASWSWGLTGAENCSGVVMRATGNKTTGVLDQTNQGTSTNNDSPSVANSITPTAANSLLVMSIVGRQTGGDTADTYAIATDDPTWTERIDATDGSGNNIAVATAPRPETTATGNSSFNMGVSGTTDVEVIMTNFLNEPNVTVSAVVDNATFTVQDVGVVGEANVSATVNTATFSVQDPVISTQTVSWDFESRPPESTWVIENQT